MPLNTAKEKEKEQEKRQLTSLSVQYVCANCKVLDLITLYDDILHYIEVKYRCHGGDKVQ